MAGTKAFVFFLFPLFVLLGGCSAKSPLTPPPPEVPDTSALTLSRAALRRLKAVVPAFYGPAFLNSDTVAPSPRYTSEFMLNLDLSAPESDSIFKVDTTSYGRIQIRDWNRHWAVSAFDTLVLVVVYDSGKSVSPFDPEIFQPFSQVSWALIKYFGYFPGPPFEANRFVPLKMTAIVYPIGGLFDSAAFVMAPPDTAGDSGMVVKTLYFNLDSALSLAQTPSSITNANYLLKRTDVSYYHTIGSTRFLDSVSRRTAYTFLTDSMFYTSSRYRIYGIRDTLYSTLDTVYRGSRSDPFSDTLSGGRRAEGGISGIAFIDSLGDTLVDVSSTGSAVFLSRLHNGASVDSLSFANTGGGVTWSDTAGAMIWNGEAHFRYQALHVRLRGIDAATGRELLSGVITLDPFFRKGRGTIYSGAARTAYTLTINLDGVSRFEGIEL